MIGIKKQNKKKYLIIGGTGYLGSLFVKNLQKKMLKYFFILIRKINQ